MNPVKKVTSYILIGLVIISTIIALLGIWEFIEIRDLLFKSLKSVFVIFVAAVIILFIVAVVMREDNQEKENLP